MFEKEAEEIVKRNVCGDCNKCQSHGYIGCEVYRYSRDSYLRGVNDGYNKANEWHDLRKNPNDLPKDTDSLYLVRVYTWDSNLHDFYKKYSFHIPTVCYWNGKRFIALDNMAYSNAISDSIAWKEIVLPELKESE